MCVSLVLGSLRLTLTGMGAEAAVTSPPEVVRDDSEGHLENDLDTDFYAQYSYDDEDKYVNVSLCKCT